MKNEEFSISQNLNKILSQIKVEAGKKHQVVISIIYFYKEAHHPLIGTSNTVIYDQLHFFSNNQLLPSQKQQLLEDEQQSLRQTGLESQAQNLDQYLKILLETGNFLPEEGMTKEQKLDFKLLFTNLDNLDNNRNLGTIIGLGFLGFVGFVAGGFTVIGAAGGGFLGILLGRYAGKKITKKIYKKSGKITQYTIFKIRIKCILKWFELMKVKYSDNLNMIRFCVEKVVWEIKPLLHYQYFSTIYQKKSLKLLNNIKKILKNESELNGIAITLKLSEEFIKIVDEQIVYSKFSKNDVEYMIAHIVHNVFRPFYSLFQNESKDKKIKQCYFKVLFQRINNFLLNKTVLSVVQKHPDNQMTIEYIKIFSQIIKQKVQVDNLEQFLEKQRYHNLEDLGFPQNPVDQNQNESIQKEKESNNNNQLLQQIFTLHTIILQRRSLSIQHIKSPERQSISRRNSLIELRQVNQEQKIDSQQQSDRSFLNKEVKSKTPKPFHQSFFPFQGDNGSSIEIISIHSKHSYHSKHSDHSKHSKHSKNESGIILKKPDVKISEELEKKFLSLVEIIEEPNETWELVLKKEQIFIVKTFKPGNEAVFVKGYADIGSPKEILFQAIYNEEFRKSWDKVLQNFHVVEKENDTVDIVYYYVESPFGVANRDFLQKRIVRYNYPKENQICLLYFSCENKKAPKPKGYVRGETLLSGYILEDLQQQFGSRLYFCSNNDVKGSIPKSLVNFVATRAPVNWFNSLRKGCENYQKFQKQQQQKPDKKNQLLQHSQTCKP